MKTEDVMAGLLKHARPEILKEFREDSCIASTAIGLDILTHFGVLAEPLAVRTLIFNPAFAARIDGGASWPTGDEIKRWTVEDGSYSVGIGVGTQQPGKWAGHLVILAEKKWIIDLSIDQASRPKYNMNFESLCVEAKGELFVGRPQVFPYNGCIFRMEILSRNLGYTASPDWIFVDRRKKIVQNILRRIKGTEK